MEPTTPTTERPGRDGRDPAPPATGTKQPGPPVPPAPGMGRLLARQATPHYAAGCLIAAAAAANAAGELSGEAATAAAATVGVLFVIAVLLACSKNVRLRLTAIAAECGRAWLGALAIGAAAWVAVTGIVGVSVDTVAALLALAYGMAGRWWKIVRIPNPSIKPAPTPVVAPAAGETVDQVRRRWAESIGCKGGRLAGSKLLDRTEIPAGRRYRIALVPGQQEIDDVYSALPRIASGLRCDRTELFVEPIAGDGSLVDLNVLDDSPIKRDIVMTALDESTPGAIALGPWGDGTGNAMWRVYGSDSIFGGVITGGSGSGKSTLLGVITIGLKARGDTVVWHIDGQDGASLPHLFDHFDFAVGRKDALAMIRIAAAEVEWRSRQNFFHKWPGFDPVAQGRPGIVIIIDECQDVFGSDPAAEIVELSDRISRKGRKCGVAIIAATQYAEKKSFGGSNSLRSGLMQGNAVTLRTTRRNEKGFFPPSFTGDPVSIPVNHKGQGYLIDVTGSDKHAPFKSCCFADDLDRTATDVEYSLDWWLAQCPETALDAVAEAVASEAGGMLYTNRHDADVRAEGALDAGTAAMIANLEKGIRTGFTAAMATLKTDHGSGKDQAASLEPIDELPRPRLIVLNGRKPRPAAAPAAPSGALSESAQRLLDQLHSGPKRPKELVDALGLGRARVNELLGELVDAGLVHRPTYGQYALTDQGDQGRSAA